jgi:hypothetical protein
MTKAELLKVLDKELIDIGADYAVPTPLSKSNWLCPFTFSISVMAPPKKTRGQEIAESLDLTYQGPLGGLAVLSERTKCIACAIDAAISAEREACAKVAEGCTTHVMFDGASADKLAASQEAMNHKSARIAAAIRARGTPAARE